MSVGAAGARVLGRYRPQTVHGSTLFASRGLEVLASNDGGESFRRLCGTDTGWLDRWASGIRIFERVGRLGIHDLRVLEDGALVGIVRGHIVHRQSAGGPFRPVYRLPRGSRPLRLCLHSAGMLYFGEYFSNPRREPVRVFGSPDGRQWEPVHTFPAGGIRHVHGVVYDRFRDGLWVLTGDEDEESGLWFTGDGFDTLELVVGGTQRARAVSVIPTEQGLIVPTDSPRIENAIQLLELPEARLTSICPLPGSAFHALESAGLYLVSTVAEPSPVNDETGATLFASLEGESWQRVDRVPPDVLCRILPFAKKILRYPEIALTPGDNETPFVFGFGRSVQGADGRLVRWSQSELRSDLTDPADPVG